MDSETLIRKVFLKSPIWEKKLKVNSNRKVVGKCWKEISKEMKVPEGALRKKWKYLRDQFSVELGKVTSCDPGDKTHEPKWPYYKSLLFLKDVVKPRVYLNNIKTKNTAMSWETNESLDEEQSENTNEKKHEPEFISFNEDMNIEENNDTDDSNQGNVRKRKKKDTYNESLIDIEKKKANFLEEALLKNQIPENEDLLFFRSLLPHIDNIPANMKLRFRNRIQEVVDEFAYPVHHSNLLKMT